MQSESGRYINSVSDLLYSADEIEFLLDDIKDLEPINCKPEDIQEANGGMSCVLQDFEIAGSRTGPLSAECAGGCECESPVDTANSWDSHSHYRNRAASPDLSLYSGVIVFCDHTHLKTPVGFCKLLLLISTLTCLVCLCTSGTVKVGLFMLPLVGRLRLMIFVSLLSLFVTSVFLFLDISHMVYLFPFNWGKVNTYFYLSLSVLFLIASTFIFHAIFLSEAFTWVPKWTHHQLLLTGCLGYVCCLESIIIVFFQKWRLNEYQPVVADSNINLMERQSISPPFPHDAKKCGNQSTHISKPVAKTYRPVASSSKQESVDIVQPCSSKTLDVYRVA